MRFIKDGPSIPDELLLARDEGRVVFFCGAGLSKARANLPDFYELVEKVIYHLHLSPDHRVCKILKESEEIEKRTGESGLISIDRIFGLLEREFNTSDIQSEVVKILKPHIGVDISAHKIILNLATTEEGKIQLVTTNFDRLFEECKSNLKYYHPPKLPDISNNDELDGIVYLHGCAKKDYSGTEGNGFILSSSEFGRAYLSDGWAASFFKDVIERYIVVFIGYSADDPPIQYLLEALKNKLINVYAFESGYSNESDTKWFHRGIKSIVYEKGDKHSALWKTLEGWAERAKSPQKWYQKIIELSKNGPRNLLPHERGQVAHIVSTVNGARMFSEADPPPSAEWLCVFDSNCRYANPGNIWRNPSQEEYFDPFINYNIDSDIPPIKNESDNFTGAYKIPDNAWDAFSINVKEYRNLRNDNYSTFRGYWAKNMPRLSSRLNQLGIWFQNIFDRPTTIWWAANQVSLHPDIQKQIKWIMEHSQNDISDNIRKLWNYLFEFWEKSVEGIDLHLFDIKAMINKSGWHSYTARKYIEENRPFIEIKQNFQYRLKPPNEKDNLNVEEIISLDVIYPDILNEIAIPDEWIPFIVSELRKNLEFATQIETEIGGYGLHIRTPIIPDESSDIDNFERTKGLTGNILFYYQLFLRFIELDINTAHREFMAWPSDDIFNRLRVGVSLNSKFISSQEFGKLVIDLSDNLFWDNYFQRDLLFLISRRWNELNIKTKKLIEKRLLKGRPKWKGEDDKEHIKGRNWESLNRIFWLSNIGCEFTFNFAKETKKLRTFVPEWKPEYSSKAADSWEMRGGWVGTNTDYSSLLNEPINNILSKAKELSGRSQHDVLTQNDPFAGLSAERPVRAYRTLMFEARFDKYPEWAWSTFLYSKAREKDKPKFFVVIAERICSFPNKAIINFIRPLSSWFLQISRQLSSNSPDTFNKLILRFIEIFSLFPEACNSTIIDGNKKTDWYTLAINSPVGNVAQALYKDPQKDNLKAGAGFPKIWISYLESLLSLKNNIRRYAIAIFSIKLSWFYSIDPAWTENHLLCVLSENDLDDQDALWSGFFCSSHNRYKNLNLRIKSYLIDLAKSKSTLLIKRGHLEALTAIILTGWGSNSNETQQRFISNDEMRDVLLNSNEKFRVQILIYLERWSSHIKETSQIDWAKLSIEFFTDIWPRQKTIKSSNTTIYLFNAAFSNEENFPHLAKIILPLLTTVDSDRLILPNHKESFKKIIKKYPCQVLDLLDAILSDNVYIWPFGINDILQEISEADKSLNNDKRLRELKRKWNAR